MAVGVGGLSGCRRAPAAAADPGPERFIDQLPAGPQRGRIAPIDGVTKPILPPFRRTEDRFAILRPPPHPELIFSAGIGRRSKPVAVRFEVLLQPPQGEPVPLYAKELREPGWSDERIDLGGRDLRGATLIFRRTQLDPPSAKGSRGVWGNPMLIAAPGAPRPSLILISIDTLRADFTSPYGRSDAHTAALDRLAREGTLYEQAYSPSTWTLPSHASLFYGMHLPESPTTMRGENLIPNDALAAAQPLAMILRNAGYLTAGVTGGGFLDWPFDFPRGFDGYFAFQQIDATGCPPNRFDGETVFRRASDWLRANGRHPFFLFVHTYDVHDRCPFVPPDTPAFVGWPELSPERHAELLTYYGALIANTDRRVAALLDLLDQLGLRDSTLVIFVSDHGEAYAEHGVRGHGCDMKAYEEVSRVPLIVRFPGHVPAGLRVKTPVSLIDVAPTALALLGVPPQPWMEGRPLPGLGLPGAATADDPVFVECGDALMVRRGAYKLIASKDAAYPDEVYDLAEDPREQHALTDHETVHAQLRDDATRFWQHRIGTQPTPMQVPEQLDDATKERLRALGYVH